MKEKKSYHVIISILLKIIEVNYDDSARADSHHCVIDHFYTLLRMTGISQTSVCWFRYSFICQGSSTRRQRRDLPFRSSSQGCNNKKQVLC